MSNPNGNGGEDARCCFCDKPGNTAHDLTWHEQANGWLCDECEYNACDYFRDYPNEPDLDDDGPGAITRLKDIV